MSNVKFVRVVPALLLAPPRSPCLAGCGSTGAGREARPRSCPRTSPSTSPWTRPSRAASGGPCATCSAKFPDGEGALEELLDEGAPRAPASTSGDGLQDALGPEVAIAVLDVPASPGAEAPVVLLTQPGRRGRASRQLVEERRRSARAR